MSLALNEPKQVAFHLISKSTSKDAPQVQKKLKKYCMQNNKWKIIGDNF